ncbi:phospholipid-transporting ATPase ID-like isoform X2 [Labeo rohita]|uniref:Phospholipid-transporting ATPase n=1 Tax=Labeo rohita TaxID=84645 RepID=A0A498LU16_LABRO|nr:phospholipid-transporting ATPase ID-like isoform X2 [Labeo rohita]
MQGRCKAIQQPFVQSFYVFTYEEQDKDQRVPRPLLALFGSRERVSEVSEEHQSQAEVGSLTELCSYGGVDYKSSDGWLSEDDEELPSRRTASLSSDISAFSSVTLLSTDELDRLLDDVRGLGDETLQKYEDVQVVVLHKEVGSGLGFTLAGGVDQNKPVTVHRVIPGGVAAQEGSIFEGAQVLSINGSALQNSAHWEALRILRKARGQGMAVVVLQSGNSRKEANERTGITGSKVRVILNKSSSDLGFSLEGGVGSSSGDKPLTVQKIFRDAIMDYSGGVLTVVGPNETASIFATYPSDMVSIQTSFLDQVIGTAMLMLCILPLNDQRNAPAPKGLLPPVVATVVLGISVSMSANCGAAINPARDLGPRLFTLTAGWGTEVFTFFHGTERQNFRGVEMFRKRPPPGVELDLSDSVKPDRNYTEEERRVRANDREYNEKFQYASNCIMTSKYNIITFLPVNLFEQFQEVANTYFLFLLILQLIPQISSLSWFTTIVPLVLVLSITAVKDATDDYFRHKSDNQVNNRQSQVLIGGILQKEKWMNVRVGDIIKLENNQFVAHNSESFFVFFCRSETNMKVRQSLSVTSELGDPNNLAQFDGPDTKLMQNSGRTKFKRTSIDRLMNTLVLWIFGFLVCMGVILAIGNAVWEKEVGALFQSFLPWDPPVDNFLFSAFLSFWSYVIILNTVVPISLYVSVEVIRLGHSYFINWDRRMFCSRSNTAAEARTTTLNEELGQVEYIFSDKTGTLTQNIMTFNKCSINGHAYGEVMNILGAQQKRVQPLDFSAWNPLADRDFCFYDQSLLEAVMVGEPAVHEFFRVLSLCHTVMSEEKSEGELVYKAQSPDEGALVTAARNFGFVFRSRTPGTVTAQELGKAVTYTLLAILDFNNIRKRMSVIGDGLRTLAVAYRDLSEEQWEEWSERFRGADKATDCRDDRLAAAYEEIEQDMMLLGATAIEDKLQEGVPETIAILSLANIKIWVLTGDKQETAVNIGYSCKMLTDDMTEIFIVNGHTVQSVREELRKARERMLESTRTRDGGKEAEAQGWVGACAFGNGCGGGAAANWMPDESKCPPPQAPPSSLLESISGEFALIISGHSLAHALEADMEREFLETACACRAVICCRVTPLQKALVVELVKRHKKAVTLAIGDGANDVSMIKTAHIGVGISGQEGIQAVLASDYSFSQFRFLQRLLLVHGRWSYLRMCRFLCYFFYKNFAFTMVHFWFGFFCGFSAQTVYDQYFITLYNIVYTSLPVLAMGIFDQDVPEQRSLEYPKLYEPGQLNLLFNKREFFICIAQGIYTSVVLFFIPYGVLSHATQSNGVPLADYQTFAVTTATALVIVVSVQIALDTGYWTAINHFFIWGSLGTYFTILFAMHSSILFNIFPKQFHFLGSAHNTLGQPVVWLTIALATVICIAPVLAFRFLKLDLKPQLSDTVRYTQLVLQKKRKPAGRAGRGVGGAGVASGSSLGRLGRGGSRRSGYAFAHQEGFGELITSGKNMRLSSLALATFASRHSSSWIDTLRRKKHANSTGVQNTPPTGEDNAASSQAPTLSTSSSAAGEAGQPCNEPIITQNPDDIALSVIRCPERDAGECSTATLQEAPFVWKGSGVRISGASSPGPPPIAEETSSGE